MWKLLDSEKKRVVGLVGLTLFHSCFLLAIPFALKEIQRLSNIKLKKEEEESEEKEKEYPSENQTESS